VTLPKLRQQCIQCKEYHSVWWETELTSHPHPGYVFANHVPPTSSLFSTSSKLRIPNFLMICTARPRPLMPAPMIKTSVSNDILE
jgi:hypothetical protein